VLKKPVWVCLAPPAPIAPALRRRCAGALRETAQKIRVDVEADGESP
jgi:hypothetical protein